MKLKPAISKEDTRIRLRIFSGVVLFILAVLALRLVQMQVLDRERYTVEAEGNALEEKLIRPARGYLLDRNGEDVISYTTLQS